MDIDLNPGADIGADVDVDTGEVGGCHPLAAIGFGKMPTFIVLLLLASLFGIGGLLVQASALQVTSALMNPWLASSLAIVLALPLVSVLSRFLAQFMLRDETEAVSEDSFVGKTATITLGQSARGHAAQAKLTDQFGQSHYVLVEPFQDGVVYGSGTSVLLVERTQKVFLAVENSIAGLDALSEPPVLDSTENQNATG